MKTVCVVAQEPNRVVVGEYSLREPRSDEVVIATAFSTISPGTELRCLAGREPNPSRFPMITGYSLAGPIVRGAGEFQPGVRELLPDLIEAGLDAINPVQITCQGMDASGLKRDFGKDLTFWGGGCDTRSILPHGSPADVAKHVRQQVLIMNQGGGFVFQQVHNIMANVPPANIVAMLEAVAASNE